MKVCHKTFGNGIVKKIVGDRIIVTFGNVDKTFQFPQVFDKYLMTDDPSLLKKIDEANKNNEHKEEIIKTNNSLSKKPVRSTQKKYCRPIGNDFINPLVGDRAQTIPINSEEEMFEIIGYMATPGRVSSIEAEVPKDGRDKTFERLFPGQKYRPIELGNTPSGMPNKLSLQFRINFGNLRNCPRILMQNMGKGNSACVGRINKSKFVIQIVQYYGFEFGDYQDIEKIRNIAIKHGYLDAFERGYSK